jgi:ABC-type nitrate/sulfonate/bicarbonate transport system substrate-binding protein
MNMRNRLLLSIGLPILLVVVVISAFFWQQSASHPGQPAQSSGPQKLTTLKLALDWTPNTNHTGIFVAQEQGWYRAQGINLQILPYSSNITPDTMVSLGQADVGISSTESVVADAAVGQPVVSIAAILQHNTSALVTLASSGLTSPRDLDGKTYGGFGAPYESAVVGQIIKDAGGKGTFKNVTLDVDAMDALKAKRIDFAWVFMGVEGVQAQIDNVKLNVFPVTQYGIPDYYTPTIITGPTQIKQESSLLHKFIQATARGYEFAQSNPKAAAQLLMNSKAVPEGTFPNAAFVLASQQYNSAHYADPGHHWGLQDAAAWQGYPEFMLKSGSVLDKNGKPVQSLDLNSLYTNAFLS